MRLKDSGFDFGVGRVQYSSTGLLGGFVEVWYYDSGPQSRGIKFSRRWGKSYLGSYGRRVNTRMIFVG